MDWEEFLIVRNIFPNDTINELRRARAANPLFDREIGEYKKQLEEDDEIDYSYKKLLLCLVNLDENFEPQYNKDDVNERNANCDSYKEYGPQRDHFFEHFEDYDNFHGLEHEKHIIPVVNKYGRDMFSDQECNRKPRSKQRRATKQKIVPSDQRRLTRSQVNDMVDNVENAIRSPDLVLESHKERGPELGKKVSETGQGKVGPSNQMSDVENQPFFGRLANEIVENVKRSLCRVLISHQRKLAGVVKSKMGPLDSETEEECNPEIGRERKRAMTQKIVPSNERRQVANDEVDNVKGLPYVVLDSHQECDPELGNKAKKFRKTKVGPPNQMPDVENQPSNALTMTGPLAGSRKSTNKTLHKDIEFEPEPTLPSNQVPSKKKHKHDLSSYSFQKAREVTLEVDKVYHDRERNLEPRRELSPLTKQKVGPSNQPHDVRKKHQRPCSLNKTRGLTKRKVKLDAMKVTRAVKQNVRPSKQMLDVNNKRKGDDRHSSLEKKKCLTQRISPDEVKVENTYSPIDLLSDHEHFNFYDNLESYPDLTGLYDDLESYPEYDLDGDHEGYVHKCNTVANDEKNSGANEVHKGDTVANEGKNSGANEVKEELVEYSDSEVEILDNEAIIEKGILGTFVPSKRVHDNMGENVDGSSESNEFRKQVLDVLRKPFNKEEYLRHQEAAKCYLDHHKDLRRKLTKHRYDQGKRLTIYRGFFFWLQNLTQVGSFKPWEDRECLAVEPGNV